ncbi:hypothetical protein VOLCADRAFT_115818 [Volvox carteri f. nagariensis]|uniref:Sister chromatid cohesion protein n=1 Tax=Volvox carteri f. nagariensis TaxID=3068 RepID=D8TIH2_VOLCA|nr:uncharacterized protein VOLCADRAFT_115818 [Volvox carteri f. nagariensis]EFJ52890.1 hypothetical protein VOLCADRAFT_115818 [Volvox carteri f. nagariensis]|eukprot:XP_002945895.1 hypothetical protein VOLCADRAFT_115818 [Volvox carteri f. nagariensis]
MAGPRFKLDLVSYDDPVTLLRLPVSAVPSSVALHQYTNDEIDEQLALNRQLLEQLDAVLNETDILYVNPVNTDVFNNPCPSCRLAKSLLSHNPLLFHYGVADADAIETAVTTPGKQSAMAVSAHNTKLTSFLEASIAEATSRTTVSDGEHQDGRDRVEDGDGCGGGRRRQQARRNFRLETLKELHGQLLTAQAQGYLQLVPHALLQSLLLALHCTAETGRKQMLPEDSELKSPLLRDVTAALEAVLCELVVYTTPKLPPSLYLEEILGCAVELTNYHLQYNVLPLHDLRFKRVYRPGVSEDEEEEPAKPAKTPRGRGAGASAAGRNAPRWTAVLVGQLEQAFSLLAQVMGLARMDVEGLIPLLRMSQQTLTVASLQTLHYRALGLAVSMFKYYPMHRETVLGKVVEGLTAHMNTGKHLTRHFPLQTLDNTTNIQMSTALVMQLIQVAAELPKVDVPYSDALMPAKLPSHWADHFWRAIITKLPSARAGKADTSSDLKAWVEALVEDLLAALPLPEWPAAALVCIELLGLVARRLYVLAKEADSPEATRTVAAAVDAAIAASKVKANDGVPEKGEVAQELLIEHLTVEAGTGMPAYCSSVSQDGSSSGAVAMDISIAGSARQLIACNMLLAHDKAMERQQGCKLDDKQTKDAILHYQQIYERQRSCLGASTSGLPSLDRVTAVALSRWLITKSVLGCSRSTLLGWLAEAGGTGRTQKEAYAAAARAKSIKLLGGAIEVDVRILSLPEVQVGIKGALSDDSVLVREAALDLIGKHISRSTDLAAQFYDVLVHAAADTGLTVRKRAVRLLWECCVRCPEFERRTDALLLIVSRATDTEDTMRALVNKICAEIWFLPQFRLESDEGSSDVSRGADQRAFQLGDVVMAIYSRMGSAISIPFHSATPIVAMIRNVVGEDGKSEYEAVRRGAREVVDVLLARALELQGEQDAPPQPPSTSGRKGGLAPSEELFQCLLALHALCVADEMPSGTNDLAGRRKAEQLLAVLAIVGGCMAALRHMDDALADEIVQDVRSIICRVSHVQAVTVACQCLCAMAKLKPRHRNTVRLEAATFYNFLDNDFQKKASALCVMPCWTCLVTGLPEKQRMYPRVLYTLGTLCRYGADILDDANEECKHPTCGAAMELVLRFYNLLGDNVRAKETALQALGFIFIARPQLAVNVRDVGPVLEAALESSAPASIKARCLSSLTDLLRSEEDVLLARQAAARQEAEAAQVASTLPDAENRALARRNGEGDSSSMLWDKILALATDTTPAPCPTASGQTPPPTPTGTAAAHGAVVRRRALDLIEVVIRGGIVVPWEALPALCALATDPERDTASRALTGLRAVVAANTAYVAGQVPRGVTEAYAFHCRLAALERPGQAPAPDKCRTLVEGLSAVWTTVFLPDKALKAKFLTALLKPLDEGCSLASGTAAKSDPYLLSFMAYIIAELPYRKMDELLAVLVRINEIVSRRAEEVLARFQDLREAAQSTKAANATNTKNGASTHSALPEPSARSTSSSFGTPSSNLAGVVKASVALSLLLLLKQYLRLSYEVTAERVAKYEPTGQQRKVEEKFPAVHNGKLRFNASKLRTDVAARVAGMPAVAGAGVSSRAAKAAAGLAAAGAGGGIGMVSVLDPGVEEVYKVLKTLMKQDELDYKQGAAAAAIGADGADAFPGQNDLRDVAINLEEIMAAPDSAAGGAKKPPLASRGRGRVSRGRGACSTREPTTTGQGRGRPPAAGRGRGSTGTKRAGRRKRIGSDSEDSGGTEDEDAGGGGVGNSDALTIVLCLHKVLCLSAPAQTNTSTKGPRKGAAVAANPAAAVPDASLYFEPYGSETIPEDQQGCTYSIPVPIGNAEPQGAGPASSTGSSPAAANPPPAWFGINLGNLPIFPFHRASLEESPAELRQLLRDAVNDLADAGGNLLRVLFHFDGALNPCWADNTAGPAATSKTDGAGPPTRGSTTPTAAVVVGCGDAAVEDLLWLLRQCHRRRVKVLLTLWSHDILAVRRDNPPENRDRALYLMRTSAGTSGYVDNCLTPLVRHLAATPIPPPYADDVLAALDKVEVLRRAASRAAAAARVVVGGRSAPPSGNLGAQEEEEEESQPQSQSQSPGDMASSLHVSPLTHPVGYPGTTALPGGDVDEGSGAGDGGGSPGGAAAATATAAAAAAAAAAVEAVSLEFSAAATYSSVVMGYDLFNEPEGTSWDLRLYHFYMYNAEWGQYEFENPAVFDTRPERAADYRSTRVGWERFSGDDRRALPPAARLTDSMALPLCQPLGNVSCTSGYEQFGALTDAVRRYEQNASQLGPCGLPTEGRGFGAADRSLTVTPIAAASAAEAKPVPWYGNASLAAEWEALAVKVSRTPTPPDGGGGGPPGWGSKWFNKYLYWDVIEQYNSEMSYLLPLITSCRLRTADITPPQLQRFLSRLAAAVHKADPRAKVTVGAHSVPYCTEAQWLKHHIDRFEGRPRNLYSDAALRRAFRLRNGSIGPGWDPSGLGTLDFYSPHGYPVWGDSDVTGLVSPFYTSACVFELDKPALVGEIWNRVSDNDPLTAENWQQLYDKGGYMGGYWLAAPRRVLDHENRATFLALLRAMADSRAP